VPEAGLPATVKKAGDMDLHFANPSRSYDPTRRAVRFWGYDRSMGLSFFVSEDALQWLEPSTGATSEVFWRSSMGVKTSSTRWLRRLRARAERLLRSPGKRFLSVGEKRHDSQ
jgi:hypothetical protein